MSKRDGIVLRTTEEPVKEKTVGDVSYSQALTWLATAHYEGWIASQS